MEQAIAQFGEVIILALTIYGMGRLIAPLINSNIEARKDAIKQGKETADTLERTAVALHAVSESVRELTKESKQQVVAGASLDSSIRSLPDALEQRFSSPDSALYKAHQRRTDDAVLRVERKIDFSLESIRKFTREAIEAISNKKPDKEVLDKLQEINATVKSISDQLKSPKTDS